MIFEKGRNIPNTFGLDVKAGRWLEYASMEELKALIAEGQISSPYLHVGSGSNLLFLGDFEGTILHSAIRSIEMVNQDAEKVWLRVGAGVIWDDFVAYCVERGYYGAENLSLIPGEVGASAVQNIGAYGVEVKDLISCVETVDVHGDRRVFGVEECGYAYRNSVFKRPDMKSFFVTHVTFALNKAEQYTLNYGTIRQELEKYPQIDLATVRQVIVSIRESKLPDPKVLGNAGSFFMNPIVTRTKYETLLQEYPSMPSYQVDATHVKIPAGWMIEQCGWKGKSLGNAAVHDKQALVLVNCGGATGADIVALSDAVRAAVREKFGVEIHPEVNMI
ncbi:UDP-N-acetylmuramate dehydrogenase [Bacteroides sp. ET489]|jgi:UDP-N-acetylmuramate dehydrogenase|uniref:UDP-N-acetylmuramate dehydrogenase n=1 Tax=Bacteroides TaxID=816 RepID=UPI0023F9A82A|nr:MULTISPECIES: UDP-N-acetylmuramate dehydrogenase [Bacteroides]MDO3391665.1 UDP-N-acetylmuramate dehydrogenase [Bacteroides sp. ET489]